MSLKTSETENSVYEFIDRVEDEQKRKDCLQLNALFQKITGEEGKMWGSSIVGYGKYSYTRSDGKFYEFMATGFSPKAANLTVYNLPGYDPGSERMQKLGKYKLGKSCLYVNKLSDIDMTLLEEIVAEGYKFVSGKHLDYKTGAWTKSS